MFRVGQSKSEVMNFLKKMKLSTEAKEKIKNFFSQDDDQKVTNEIELAMLNGWANPSANKTSKSIIPLPVSVFEPEYKTHSDNWGSINHQVFRYPSESGAGDRFFRVHDSDRDAPVITNASSSYAYWIGEDGNRDYLFDNDNDGIADERVREYENGKRLYDTDLDGLYDSGN